MLISDIARVAYAASVGTVDLYITWEGLKDQEREEYISTTKDIISGKRAFEHGNVRSRVFYNTVEALNHDPSTFRIRFTFADRLDVKNGISITVDHDPIETHDADGNELPVSAAMKLASSVFAFVQQVTGDSPQGS